MSFDQISLDSMAQRTLLTAFEYRYSVVLDAPQSESFVSVRALADFLLAQLHAGQKDGTGYVGTRRMVRTLLRAR